MRRTIVAGNWKMNKCNEEAEVVLSELKGLIEGVEGVDVIIGAPYTVLSDAVKVVKGSNIAIAAQNMNPHDSGAFTGEICPNMLTSIGVEYVILGHSERREYYGETDQIVNEKVKSALKYGLKPILCIGEKLEDREGGKTNEVNGRQLREGLAGVSKEDMKKIIVAYEPVWAIGTGKTATPDMAEETHKEIRDVIAEIFDRETAEEITIQYGGSMKPENAKELLSEKNIDGGLVGGASLEAKPFSEIIKAGVK